MIKFRLKVFSEDSNSGKSNFRAGMEGVGLAGGVLGSIGLGMHYGKKAFENYIDEAGGKSYVGAKDAWNKSKEAVKEGTAKLKGLEGPALDVQNKTVEGLKKTEKQLGTAYSKARKGVLYNNYNLEKGVGKGLMKGGLIGGGALAATLGAKKLYDKFTEK